jgi:DNA polymerase I-like protein with 3'-5' exonuclease and polymerase domains
MTYKALNAAVQGTASEQIKLAMLQLHQEKLTPLITLYDELGHSIPDDPKVSARVCEVMENAIPLLIPHHVEALMGKSWDLRKPK